MPRCEELRFVDRVHERVLQQKLIMDGFTEPVWSDVPIVSESPKLESEEDLDKIEELAKHIAGKIFTAGYFNGFVVDRIAFKAKMPGGEKDLGGLCMSSLVNVIRDALVENANGS